MKRFSSGNKSNPSCSFQRLTISRGLTARFVVEIVDQLDLSHCNLTDGESRIMPTAGGGFEQTYNAQAGVDLDTHLIVAQHLTQHPNDQQEVAPAVANLQALREQLGEVEVLLADTGYHRAAKSPAASKPTSSR